jgi:hypothetical protein
MRRASRTGASRRDGVPIWAKRVGQQTHSRSSSKCRFVFFLRSLIERAKKSYPASLTLVTAPQFWKIDLIVNSSTLVSTFPT